MTFRRKVAGTKDEFPRISFALLLHNTVRHNSEYVDHVISGTGRPQENRILRSSKTHKKIAFYPNRKFFSSRFIARNVGSDGK